MTRTIAASAAFQSAALQSKIRLLLLVAVFAAGAWLEAEGLVPAVLDHWQDILYLSRQHLELVAVSGAIATLIGVPLGVLLTRPAVRRYANIITQFVNLGSTIPTLAILALAMSVLGIGTLPSIFGLVVLTLLPIVLNTVAGLKTVPGHLIEAARGMGMTRRQILFEVELPNAMFVIFAGLRTALAINVGTVPLVFLIGGGGLGDLIFTGISLMDTPTLLAGAIPTALLAILIDFAVGQGQLWLVPRGVNPLR